MKEEFNGKEYKKTNEKRITIIIIIILVFLSIIGWNIFSGRSVSNKEDIRQNIGIDYDKSWFQSFDVENNTVRLRVHLSIYNIHNQEKTFYIRAKSSEDVGKLLKNENLMILENGKEKIFRLKANESINMDVVFEGEYGGSNQKQDRLLPREIRIVEVKE